MLFGLVLDTMTALRELVAGGGAAFGCRLPEPLGKSLPGCCQLGEGRLAPCFGQGGGSPAPVDPGTWEHHWGLMWFLDKPHICTGSQLKGLDQSASSKKAALQLRISDGSFGNPPLSLTFLLIAFRPSLFSHYLQLLRYRLLILPLP